MSDTPITDGLIAEHSAQSAALPSEICVSAMREHALAQLGELLDTMRKLERDRAGLLEALQLLHDNLAEYMRINNLGGYDNHDMRLARAAIAKATGGDK